MCRADSNADPVADSNVDIDFHSDTNANKYAFCFKLLRNISFWFSDSVANTDPVANADNVTIDNCDDHCN